MKNKWFEKKLEQTLLDKDRSLREFVERTLNKTEQMFTYKNLPDTIPKRVLEQMLQVCGFAIFTKVEDQYFVFQGGLGGEPDVYYRPTQAIVANPALKFNKTLDINKDCVIIRNDTHLQGLLPLITRYGTLLTEADITYRSLLINARALNLIDADDDAAYKSAQAYLDNLEAGKLSVISSSGFFEGVKTADLGFTSGTITDVIQLNQYLKSELMNELGIDITENFKSQYVNTTETQQGKTEAMPTVKNMLDSRRESIELINALYGLEIEVELSNDWKEIETIIEGGMEDEESEGSGEADSTIQSEPVSGEDSTEEDNEEQGNEDNKSEESAEPEVVEEEQEEDPIDEFDSPEEVIATQEAMNGEEISDEEAIDDGTESEESEDDPEDEDAEDDEKEKDDED